MPNDWTPEEKEQVALVIKEADAWYEKRCRECNYDPGDVEAAQHVLNCIYKSARLKPRFPGVRPLPPIRGCKAAA